MQKTMQALVKKKREPGLWLDEVPVPGVGINDVLIKIHKASICGTDVHIWNWDAWSQKTIPVPMTVWHADPVIPMDLLAIFDPFGNATHTALSFPVLGEDVLITGAGPIGIMATAIVRHAGARHVVVTDMNPYRLELAKRMGATLAHNIQDGPVADVQKTLGMREGFDVGLEMSGSGDALKEMLANMCHGGKIALLGIPTKEMSFDWNTVIFNMITLKGIYGREMYETWYMMQSMLQTGLDISPIITHRFHYTQFEEAFEVMRSGNAGKVVMDWVGSLA